MPCFLTSFLIASFLISPLAVFAQEISAESGAGATQDPKLVVEHSKWSVTPEMLQDLLYEYDNVGNITKITDSGGYNSAKLTNYLYDDLYRLTTASTTFATTTTSDYKRTYAYDALGNITNKSDQGAYSYTGHTGTSYANPHAVTDINGTTYTYDKNGNLTSDSVWTHTWNYNNTLATSTNGTLTASYGYDHNKQRVWYNTGSSLTNYPNKYYNESTATTTIHIFAGDTLVATFEDTGSATSTNYIHTDHLGGTSVTTDDANNTVQALDYHPFGDVSLNETSGFNEQRKFIGEHLDEEIGLNYLNARYYESARGQFLSQDSTHLATGNRSELESITGIPQEAVLSDPQLLNSYAYARNNPLRYKDPEGKFLDVVLDVGFTLYSGFKLGEAVLTGGDVKGEAINFGLDAGGLFIPGAAGLGTAKRIAGAAGKAANWGNPASLGKHFRDHGAQFGAKNAQDYAQRAGDFYKNAGDAGYQRIVGSDGTTRIYDSKTNTFGSYNLDGSTKTFFKPDNGQKYWNNQVNDVKKNVNVDTKKSDKQ